MKTLIAAAVLAVASTQVSAQQLYGGATLDYGLAHSGDSQAAASLLIGGKAPFGRAVVYGVEGETGLRLFGADDYDTTRLRGFAGYDVGGLEGRVSLGWSSLAEEDRTVTGYNFGFGLLREVNANVTARAELIRDIIDETGLSAVTTTRIGLTYGF